MRKQGFRGFKKLYFPKNRATKPFFRCCDAENCGKTVHFRWFVKMRKAAENGRFFVFWERFQRGRIKRCNIVAKVLFEHCKWIFKKSKKPRYKAIFKVLQSFASCFAKQKTPAWLREKISWFFAGVFIFNRTFCVRLNFGCPIKENSGFIRYLRFHVIYFMSD